MVSIGKIAWLFAAAIAVMIANIAMSVLYMVLYGHVIDPGHEPQFYNDHIQVAGPYCSIVAGIPLMFLAGWFVTDWWDDKPSARAALVVWLIYAAIDLLMLLLVGLTFRVFVLFVVSFTTKLLAALSGALVRIRISSRFY